MAIRARLKLAAQKMWRLLEVWRPTPPRPAALAAIGAALAIGLALEATSPYVPAAPVASFAAVTSWTQLGASTSVAAANSPDPAEFPRTRSSRGGSRSVLASPMEGTPAAAADRRSAGTDAALAAYLGGFPRQLSDLTAPRAEESGSVPPTAPDPTATPTPTTTHEPAQPSSADWKSQFIQSAVEAAQKSQAETGVPAAVTIAQAILESDWGRSLLSTAGKNFFGIKATAKPGSAGIVWMPTREFIGGRYVTVQAPFRAYNTMAESFIDHGLFLLENARYARAFDFGDDPKAFAKAIHQAGYATDPKYSSSLIALMDRFELYSYDLPSGS